MIFNSYVKLPEGIWPYQSRSCHIISSLISHWNWRSINYTSPSLLVHPSKSPVLYEASESFGSLWSFATSPWNSPGAAYLQGQTCQVCWIYTHQNVGTFLVTLYIRIIRCQRTHESRQLAIFMTRRFHGIQCSRKDLSDDDDEKFCKFPGRSESTGHPCSWGARTLSCSRTVKIWAVFKTLFSYHLLPIPRGKFEVGDLRFYWLVLIPGSGWLNHGSPVIIRWFSPHNNPIPLWMLSP